MFVNVVVIANVRGVGEMTLTPIGLETLILKIFGAERTESSLK